MATVDGESAKRALPAIARPQVLWATLVAWLSRYAVRYAAITAIMVLALALRLQRPDIAEFKIDEVQPLDVAARIWLDHRLPLTRGHTSLGLPGTPGLGYLLVLPRAVSADPQIAVAYLGFLGSLAVLATYLAVRQMAGEPLALVASALYAANPWAVFLSRKTWSEILPLFTVLILWAAYKVVVQRKPVWALAFFVLTAVQVQTHLLGVLLFPAVLLTVLVYWPRWKGRYTLWGVALGALVLLPYAYKLAGQWEWTRSVLLQQAGRGIKLDTMAFAYALWLTSGATVTALMGRSVAVLQAWEHVLRVANLITGLLMACALALSSWAVWYRKPGHERHALLLIWLAGPVVPLVFVREAMGIHYLLLLVPALYVLAGIAWVRLLTSRRRVLAAGSMVVFLALLVVQAGAVVAVYDGVTSHPTEGGFGRPLRLWRQVQQGVLARVAAEGWHELQVLGTDDAPWSSDRNVLDFLLQRSVRLRYVGYGGRAGLLVPQEGEALALVVGADAEMARTLQALGKEEAHWPVAGSEWGVRLYRLQKRAVGDLVRGATTTGPGTFESGMRLLGAELPQVARPREQLAVLTCWEYTGQGAHPAELAFNHLVDAHGRRWAQDDGFALSRSEWRPGETLVQWCQITLPADLPPGDYWLYTGMYSLRDMSRAQLLAEDGRWLSDGVRLGPIRVWAD
jgi:hypothetical protein